MAKQFHKIAIVEVAIQPCQIQLEWIRLEFEHSNNELNNQIRSQCWKWPDLAIGETKPSEQTKEGLKYSGSPWNSLQFTHGRCPLNPSHVVQKGYDSIRGGSHEPHLGYNQTNRSQRHVATGGAPCRTAYSAHIVFSSYIWLIHSTRDFYFESKNGDLKGFQHWQNSEDASRYTLHTFTYINGNTTTTSFEWYV